MAKEHKLANIPNMNSLLAHPALEGLERERVKYAAQETLEALRKRIVDGELMAPPGLDECAELVSARLREDARPCLRRLINATGVVLHTNLGRAPLGEAIGDAVKEICAGYSNLEYDLATGARGERHSHVEGLIREITGAEAAMVVNNNAAAVFLMLCTLAKGKRVAISRGELVEIGGSFRIPEIMEESGAELVEVGTTNRTRLSDYAAAVDNKGAELLLKVHTSNYEIVGFTESVTAAELAAFGKERGLPVLYDMGACFPIEPELLGQAPASDDRRFGPADGRMATAPGDQRIAHNERRLATVPGDGRMATGQGDALSARGGIASGADIVCFSGDKLLGSAQAGILAGRKDYIAMMKKHPVTRMIRPDKLTLAALEATLGICRFPDEAKRRIPVLSMLSANPGELRSRAGHLAERLLAMRSDCDVSVIETVDEAGGGALPNVPLPGWAVAVKPAGISVEALEEKLRQGEMPVIIRIRDGMALFSLRTLLPGEEDVLLAALDSMLE
jgi:L-seryl-tRNA(Ser) seleniumtransferase